ncbi:linear amide C-N hydrolase [Sediminicoccus rosea]|uniref:Linear amide C-N hydrolase n=1 Tax=Sediminicoccus rosea TaxID=1225128 RepID=A0ABZ0PLJ9_9PROT|nr:linear amide C-N hydrolase [Sediminicoccus rosea]WPB85975.1 linear amide C-N hydrolase [Sediminicoccus rosea]
MTQILPRRLRVALTSLVALLLFAVNVAQACTSLIYRDQAGRIYFGRTLELAMELPYQVTVFPAGLSYTSRTSPQAPAASWTTRYRMLAVTMPDAGPDDLKIVEGFNEAGLTFSLLAFASAAGPRDSALRTRAALAAIDLGAFTLGQFATVAEVKAALAAQPVLLTPLGPVGGAASPFHFALHDRSGRSIVVEFVNGQQLVHDNPVGVMTNGPSLPWHLTNLANYSFLRNTDVSTGQFGSLAVAQPDSGIATQGLPASNTSVGRFVRAAFYAQYAEKVAAPDDAVRTLARIMNNFDRPRNITIDPRGASGEGLRVPTAPGAAVPDFSSEYTSWTALTDLDRSTFYLRTYGGLNYVKFDLTTMTGITRTQSIPLASLNGMAADGTAALVAAR